MDYKLNILLGGVTLFALQGCQTGPQADKAKQQPNVIYVFPDQLRNCALEFWGQEGFRDNVNFRNDPTHTPRLNDFAREAVVLSSAQSNCPLSSPHRGSLLTGMYPNRSGVPLNCNSDRPISSLREDAQCVSDVFSRAGYDCAYFGKLHADFPTPDDPANPGHYVEEQDPVWDTYTPPERRHGFNYWYSYGTFDEHKNPHYWDTEGKRHDPREWSPLHEAARVVSYLKNEGNVRDTSKPFFIMVGMNPPHSPYRSLDDCMEQDYNLYKDRPLDSLLVRPNADRSQRTTDPKNSPYAESMNVPFLVRYPGKLTPRVDDLLLSSPDIMPTLLGMAGLADSIPSEVQGRNYAPLFFDPQAQVERPTGALYIQNVDGDKDAQGKVTSYFPSSRGIKTARYTLALYIDRKEHKLVKSLLFDDQEDPYQQHNLPLEKHPEVVKELCAQMAAQLKAIGDPWYEQRILADLIPYGEN